MFFPTAGISVDLWIPPLAAFVISFFTSMAGVSGAFLLLPFQMSVLGFVNPSVSATNHLFNIVAIPSGVLRYRKEGRMVWPLAWIVVLGTLPGVFLGAVARIEYLPDPRQFKLFAAAVLLFIGLRMAWDMFAKRRRGQDGAPGGEIARERTRKQTRGLGGAAGIAPVARVERFSFRELAFAFDGERYSIRTPGVFGLSFLVGVVGGVYGIGGGAIIAPFLVAFCRLPVYVVAGASLMGTFVTSLAGTFFLQTLAPLYPTLSIAPDWRLGALFGLGGMAGMYLGARCQKHAPARAIKCILLAAMLFTAGKYVFDFLA